jgi:glycosyltransferase involved in cell wall biosynthesis
MINDGFYISNIDDRVVKGYLPKVLGQVQSFINSDIKMTLLRFKGGRVALRRSNSESIKSQPDEIVSEVMSPIRKRIRLLVIAYRIIQTELSNFIYIRYTPFDPLLLFFLILIKIRVKRKLMVAVEIPTYPYDRQYLSRGILSFSALQLFFDYCTRYFLFLVVNRFVIVNCSSPSVFNVPVSSITNGVSIDDFALVPNLGKSGDPINFVFVGNAGVWHGLDRLITGLSQFYGSGLDSSLVKINLSIVGGGSSNDIRNLCLKYGVQDYVTFVGPLDGAELDEVMKLATVGVGVLASHRLSHRKFSPLKHREYCARGLPFIYDGNDDGFMDVEFAMNVDLCDQPIDIRSVILFVERLRSENDLPQKIRSYAKCRFDWLNIMAEVISDVRK